MADGIAQIVLSAQDKTKAAFESAKRGLTTLEEKADAANSGFARFGAFLGAGFAAGTFTAFVRDTVNGIDKLNDLKDATGASIENLSALEDVAARTGTSFEAMSGTVVKFNRVLSEAKAGSEAAAILQSIGLSAEELKKQDPAEALRQTAIALSQYADDGNKARIVQALFGKSVQEVAPFLKDLAEAGELQAKVTTQQAEEAERFNKQLFDLQKNSADFARTLVSGVVPVLNDIAAAMRGGREEAEGFAGAANILRIPFEAIAVLGANVSFVLQGFGREIAGWAAQLSALARGDLSQFSAISDMVKADAAKARAELDDFEQRILRLGKYSPLLDSFAKTASSFGGGGGKQSAPKLPETPPKTGAKAKLIDGLPVDRQEAFRQLENQARAAVDAAFATSQLEEAEAARIHRLKLEEEQANATAEARDRLNKRLNELLDATSDAKLEETRRDMLLLADAMKEGAISAEEFAKAAQARLGTLPENFKKATDEVTVFAEQGARNIQDALGDTVFDVLSGKFDDIGSRFSNLLKRMAAEAIAAQIGKKLFGDLGKGGSDGGLFGDVLKQIGASIGLPSFDVGTPFVPRDMVAKVHRGEAIIPAAQNRPGVMGGITVSMPTTNYIDSNTSAAEFMRISAESAAATERRIYERLRAQGVAV